MALPELAREAEEGRNPRHHSGSSEGGAFNSFEEVDQNPRRHLLEEEMEEEEEEKRVEFHDSGKDPFGRLDASVFVDEVVEDLEVVSVDDQANQALVLRRHRLTRSRA